LVNGNRVIDLASKRICVTGGAGFLGSFLVQSLRDAGCADPFVVKHQEYDLTTESGVQRLFEEAQPQVLFHLAAVVGGIGANQVNPGSFFYANAIMGIQLLEYARRFGVEKSIVIGTVCSYPNLAPIPFSEESLWDGYPEVTNAPYGIAKKILLVQCQAYRKQYGMNAIYLLPGNIYGPRDNFDPSTSHVIPAMIRNMLEANARGAGEIVCWGDGTPTREFLYAQDAAEGIVKAAQRYEGAAPVNLGSGEETSIKDLAELIAELCGYKGRVSWDTTKPNGQPRRKLNTTRAEQCFAFRAQTPLRQGLAQTIAWYRSQPSAVSA
jgi:GDP-L-fucose synthase